MQPNQKQPILIAYETDSSKTKTRNVEKPVAINITFFRRSHYTTKKKSSGMRCNLRITKKKIPILYRSRHNFTELIGTGRAVSFRCPGFWLQLFFLLSFASCGGSRASLLIREMLALPSNIPRPKTSAGSAESQGCIHRSVMPKGCTFGGMLCGAVTVPWKFTSAKGNCFHPSRCAGWTIRNERSLSV